VALVAAAGPERTGGGGGGGVWWGGRLRWRSRWLRWFRAEQELTTGRAVRAAAAEPAAMVVAAAAADRAEPVPGAVLVVQVDQVATATADETGGLLFRSRDLRAASVVRLWPSPVGFTGGRKMRQRRPLGSSQGSRAWTT